MKKLLFAFGFAAAMAVVSTPTLATPVDLTTWSALGDSLVTPGTAKVTTAWYDETPLTGAALYIDDLEAGLHATPGTLGLDVYEGSALMQSFTFSGNTNVSFKWTLGTENFDPSFADLAFALVDGSLVSLANAASVDVSGLFSYAFGAGDHTLAFGVVDVGDYIGVSTLTVSGVDVSATTVPEPETYMLVLASLGLMGFVSRRKKQPHQTT